LAVLVGGRGLKSLQKMADLVKSTKQLVGGSILFDV